MIQYSKLKNFPIKSKRKMNQYQRKQPNFLEIFKKRSFKLKKTRSDRRFMQIIIMIFICKLSNGDCFLYPFQCKNTLLLTYAVPTTTKFLASATSFRDTTPSRCPSRGTLGGWQADRHAGDPIPIFGYLNTTGSCLFTFGLVLVSGSLFLSLLFLGQGFQSCIKAFQSTSHYISIHSALQKFLKNPCNK